MPDRNLTSSSNLRLISPLIGAYVLYNALSFATLLLEVPQVRLFERSICRRFYQGSDSVVSPGKDVDESLCKVAAIQDELATVAGWQLSFNALAGLLTAVYYGRLAEMKGRRRVLLLSTCGISLMFAWVVFVCQMGLKVELVWLSSFFLLLGGGPQVFNAMIFAAVSDSLGDAERTQYLYLLHAGPHVNRLLTPRIAAALMSVALLWPFFWSFAIFGGCVLLVTIFYQEMTFRGPDITKRGYGQLRRDSTDEQQAAFLRSPQRDSEHDDSSESEHSGDPNSAYQKNPSRRNTCFALQSSWWREQRTLLLRLFGSRTAAFCLACFLFKRIAFTSEGFIFQYTSEKFGWKLRETTWLRISAAIGAIVTTMIICPTLSTVCKRKGFNTHKLDLWIIRVCLIVLCAAFMMAFEAPSAAWLFPAMLGMGLGEGTEPALQGLITFITEPSDYSQLFGVLALVDSVAGLIGGPVSASLMTVGRSQDSDSNGLNFLSSAIMFGALALCSLMIAARR